MSVSLEAVAVLCRGVLVEVVAEVQDGVQVGAPGQAAVRREPAGLPVRARDHAEPEVVRRGAAEPVRCGCGPPGWCRRGTGSGSSTRSRALRPVTSTLTVWSRLGPVSKVPRRTILRNRRSFATSQRTLTRGPLPEPGASRPVGVTRVQMRTASGSGSPEATPCRKNDDPRALPKAGASPPASVSAPAPTAPVASTARRGRDRRVAGIGHSGHNDRRRRGRRDGRSECSTPTVHPEYARVDRPGRCVLRLGQTTLPVTEMRLSWSVGLPEHENNVLLT